MKLRELLQQKGIRQQELAKSVGLDEPMISKFMNYKCLPIPPDMKLICEFLNCAITDIYLENEIYMKYSEMTQGRTSLFISHRLASTRFCDRIIFVADGGIKEEGTHESLLALGGIYAKLFEVQSRYYREGKEF